MMNDIKSEPFESDIDNEDDVDSPSDEDDDSDYAPTPIKKQVKKKSAAKLPKSKKPSTLESNSDLKKENPVSSIKKTKKTKKSEIKTEDGEDTASGNKGKGRGRKRQQQSPKKAAKRIKTEDVSDTNFMNNVAGSSNDIPGLLCDSSKVSPESSTDAYDVSNKQLPKDFKINIEKIIENAKKVYEPWLDEVVVAQATDIPVEIARNVITLLNQECTIPFIVRYRKEKTGGLQAEKLRDIQTAYDEVKLVHKKVENILKTVKSEKFDETAAASLLSAKTLEEVELLYAPFKPGSKRTLAERSKQLGLEPIALQLLQAKSSLPQANLQSYINPQKGLKDIKEVKTGIQHIIADIISKDRRVLDFIQTVSNHPHIRVHSCQSASSVKEDRRAHVEGKKTENFKYENYFNLNIPLKFVAHHQVMALNRGEKQKVLTVKVEIPFDGKRKVKDFIWRTFFNRYTDQETSNFFQVCMEDSYDRLIEPHLIRQIRSTLTKRAEKESIAIFCSNVRSLLLTPPVRGKTVVGIDPGFSHGCKIAAVSSKGEVLETGVIYPHSKNKMKQDMSDSFKLKNIITAYGAEIVAIGNGTACRETELWLSNLITSKFFHPCDIKYCIVNESGVSIYSVTKEAETELPNMDPNQRSAVAIARRLQDPLLEYVKIEPKHLGVGMYQHDLPEVQLKKALDSVVEECVSFVGVDLNVCPEFLLRKISGLSTTKAKQIVEFRTKHGAFINRQQLLEVKGLGPKSFEQCAGFVKILPETSSSAISSSNVKSKKMKTDVSNKPNPLDRTIIHPESYDSAQKFLNLLKLDANEIGMQTFVDKVKAYMSSKSTEYVSSELNVPVTVMQLIIDAFKQLLDYDIRGEFDQPLFMTSVRKFADLKVNQELTGRITNIAGFGAFVDIGVEKDGLIHVSKMGGQKLSVGERVTVKVLNFDIEKKRINLQLLRKNS